MLIRLAIAACLAVSCAAIAQTPQWFVVDRFEDQGWAVLETPTGGMLELPQGWLPSNARAGDVLRLVTADAGSSVTLTFVVDLDETRQRRSQASQLRESLPVGPSGSFDL